MFLFSDLFWRYFLPTIEYVSVPLKDLRLISLRFCRIRPQPIINHQINIRIVALRVAPFQLSNMPIPRITSKLPGSQSPNEPPSELDKSGNSNHIDLLADVAAEQAARRRAGLCPQCGVVQTHTIVLWGRRKKPIQVCFS